MTGYIRAESPWFRLSHERKARGAVMAFLIVALIVVFSALAQRGTTSYVSVGTVVGFEPGEWIYLDSMEWPIALREATAYDDGTVAIRSGVRVQVWARSVGERRPVAARVRVLPEPPPR